MFRAFFVISKREQMFFLKRIIFSYFVIGLFGLTTESRCLTSEKKPQSVDYALRLAQIPRVQIHRGFTDNGRYIENTIEAFRAANRAGHHMIELDVRFSKDQQVVVFHDTNLKRVFHDERDLSQIDAKELNESFQIPTLKSVLADALVPQFMNIELKQELKQDLGLERAVYDLIAELHVEDRVLITSFNESVLQRMYRLTPNLMLGYLVEPNLQESQVDFIERIKTVVKPLQSQLVSLNAGSINEALVAELKKEGVAFFAWTINDEVLALEKLKLGAVSIITDRVDLPIKGPNE